MVGENVEHSFGIGWGIDFELDRTSGVKRVGFKRSGSFDSESEPATPVGFKRIAGSNLHKRCKGFVQPDSIPPAHGDEITKPHVGKLVCNNICNELAFGLSR